MERPPVIGEDAAPISLRSTSTLGGCPDQQFDRVPAGSYWIGICTHAAVYQGSED